MSATTSGRKATTNDADPMARLDQRPPGGDTVAGAAGEMAARFSEAASTTRDAIGEANRAFQEANRMVRAGSDEALKVVGAASVGFAGGLFFGGANRFLVIAALVPAALVGSEYVQRQSTTTP